MQQLSLLFIALLGCSMCFPHLSLAQSQHCHTMEYHQTMLDQYPGMQAARAQIEQFTQAFVGQGEPLSAPVYTIPVVVHVVWKDSSQWVSHERVQAQIQNLNLDFRRMNTDTSDTPLPFQGVAADTELEFCLASQTPHGAPTDGIQYVQTTENDFTIATDEVKFSSLGGSDAWPRAEYLNIWVCQLEAGGVTGYATLPGGPPAVDGVVIDHEYFGSPALPSSNGSIGRVLTHEVGHWFNLNHVWGDGDCSVDDEVADTPIQDGPIYNCPSFPLLNCNSGPDGAMFMNYMQYVDDSCMNLFTQGQKQRMRAQLQTGAFRNSLRNSPGCDSSTQCPTTVGLIAQSSQPDQAQFFWGETTYAGTYELRYRVLGGGSWTSLPASDTSLTITGLAPCTIYEWQVRTLCLGGSYGPYSLLQYVTTAGCQQSCDAPDSITLEPGIKSALLHWSPSPNALDYQVQYQALGDSSWRDTVITDTSLFLEELLFCESYHFRLQSRCAEGYAGFSLLDTFTTLCDNYCVSQGSSTEFEWIEEVLIGSLNPYFNQTGDDDGFGYYVSDTIDLFKNAGISFRLRPGYSDAETAVTWTVWVDWNQDGSFLSHPDEKLLIALNETGDVIETVFLPVTLPNGVFRMRVQMKQGGSSLPCDVFPRGEVEDYSLRIVGIVGVTPNMAGGSFQVFPNPSEGIFNLHGQQLRPGPVQLKVFDLQGRLLWHEHTASNPQSWRTTVDLRAHPQGVYLLQIQTESGIWQQKLIHH